MDDDESNDSSSSSSRSNGSSADEEQLSLVASSSLDRNNNDCDVDEQDHRAQHQVRRWTERVPIGLGFCPWAVQSMKLGNIKYHTVQSCTPLGVKAQVIEEMNALLMDGCCNNNNSSISLALRTTMIVCPNVTEWKEDFSRFDSFVKSFNTNHQAQNVSSVEGDVADNDCVLMEQITLVSFHPRFLRWRGLPKGIKVGTVVHAHQQAGGFQKTLQTFPATIVETRNPAFGLRKIKIRFHNNEKEQYVPVDWCVFHSGDGDNHVVGPSLPDNDMHRAPFPTIHLIRNEDLVKLSARDVSRVKRKNANRMMNRSR